MRISTIQWQVFAWVSAGLVACSGGCSEERFAWDLPPGIPDPVVPDDNPMTMAKVELGRFLFYDKRLSANEAQSCASCHLQENGFAEPLVHSIGSTGDETARNSPTLTNVAYNSTYTWASSLIRTLQQQALLPMFGENPIELGITGHEEEVLERFSSDVQYQQLFAEAYPDEENPFTFDHIIKAITSFVRTMISFDSPYDRRVYLGQENAMSESAIRGSNLFFSERLECHHCHGAFNFSQSTTFEGARFLEAAFFNTGLYNIDGQGAYPFVDRGLMDATNDPADMGKFRPPTLRNIAKTAPYFHDGSAATLEEVIAIYEAGGRNIESGDNAGNGATSPLKNGFVTGFTLTDQERADLIAFLESLTDETFLSNPKFSNPFE